MKNIRFSLMSLGMILGLQMLPLAAQASNYCATNNPDPALGVQALSQPANRDPLGMQIGTIGTDREARVFDGRNTTLCRLIRAWATPANPLVAGVQYQGANGQTYDVFETGIPGIGYAIGITDYADSSFNYQPLQGTGITPTFNGPQVTESIGYSVQIVFVATGSLRTGNYPLTNKIMANFFAETTSGTTEADAYIQVSADFEITARTCQVVGSPLFTMTLPPVSTNAFINVPVGSQPASNARSNTITINLDCDDYLSLYATMTDNNNQESTKNYLEPSTGVGMATGVGVQVFRDGWSEALRMGPDSPAAGNPNQWFIQNIAADREIVPITLYSQYIRTDTTIEPGMVNAVATMTFSYR